MNSILTTESSELSQAIVVYLGFEVSPFPVRDRTALAARFGSLKSLVLERQIIAVLRELSAVEVDWSKYSLGEAGKMASLRVQIEHRELSETARKALEWKFTFDWH